MADSFPQIRHIVVLALENRSFDHMLGDLPGVDGVQPTWTNSDGVDTYAQIPIAGWDLQDEVRTVDPDPRHDERSVRRQIADDNRGFVADYALSYPGTTPAQRQKIMAYYPYRSLGPLHELATTFAVCQRWHASVPGPTWTNRLFLMSGTSLGRVAMPGAPNYGQPSIFYRLWQAGRTSRVYYGTFPLSLLLDDQRIGIETEGYDPRPTYYPFGFFERHARGRESNFPDFVFIEPRYLGFAPNDDHPPHDPFNGQRLIARIYNALRANEALWRTTMFIILYDEHGGFADHVSPPPAVPPDDEDAEYDFKRLGVRVPAVIVSPWVTPQIVDALCDHTSLLRSLIEKWGLGALGARAAQATDVFAALQPAAKVRLDTPRRIGLDLPGEMSSVAPPTTHQDAVEHLAHAVDPTPGRTPSEIADRFFNSGAPRDGEAP
jgi:phospholipase C